MTSIEDIATFIDGDIELDSVTRRIIEDGLDENGRYRVYDPETGEVIGCTNDRTAYSIAFQYGWCVDDRDSEPNTDPD